MTDAPHPELAVTPRLGSPYPPAAAGRSFDLAVFIGRFQPFHNGHLGVVQSALEVADRVLILQGSANLARDTRNPFPVDIMKGVILGALLGAGIDPARVTIQPLNDHGPFGKESWISNVQLAVRNATPNVRPRVCLTGHMRDATSDYLRWFPEWRYVPASDTAINATALRKAYFAGAADLDGLGWVDNAFPWREMAPDSTIDYLRRFRDDPLYGQLLAADTLEREYREKWGDGPHQTVDPVIVQGGYLLVVRRGPGAGEGKIALPGGYLEKDEELVWGAAREAVEETCIFTYYDASDKEKEKAMRQLLTYQRGHGERFSDPHRSRLGRIITEAFFFRLPDAYGLPLVTGADDAKEAFWMPISEVRPDIMHDDHAWIVDRMLSLNY